MHYELTSSNTGVAAIKLELGSITFTGVNLDDDSPLRTFPISAYTNIFERDESGGSLKYRDLGALDCINNFFATLSEADCRVIALTLLLAHSRIRVAFETGDIVGLSRVADNVGELICKNFMEIALLEKFHEYILKNITITIRTDWGSRPIDTEDMTYTKQDVIDLHTLVFLGKLMLPIFGAVITRAQSHKLGPKVAELHCLPFIMPLINAKARLIKNKLMRYIRAATSKIFVEDATVLHSGFSKNYAETVLMAMFLIRNTVNHNVYMPGSNLITALNGCVTQTARSFKKDAKKSNHIEFRKLKSVVAEEPNQSRMEVDSIVSTKTADVPIIAKTFTKTIVQRFLNNNGLDVGIHRRVVGKLHTDVIQINSVSKIIIETLFCREFNGIVNMNYLRLPEMVELLAAAQQLTAKYGYGALAHACAVRRTGNIRVEQTEIDRAMVLGYNKSREYKRYVLLFDELPLDSKELRGYFDEVLTDILNEFTTYELTDHTPPDICQLLNEEWQDGTLVQFNSLLMDQLYLFLHDCWVK
jgi:hypothetical protein